MLVMIRGGGDLASGAALRLHRVGMRVLITELAQPLVVRRLVSFAEAVYRGQTAVEEVTARRVKQLSEVEACFEQGTIPVLVDPEADSIAKFSPEVFVDGRMSKRSPEYSLDIAPMVIGLGPGFIAGKNCHAAIETNRGHRLGRVVWDGETLADTGIPESVLDHSEERVLRSPADGTLITHAEICDQLERDQLVAEVGGQRVTAPFRGVLRGILHPGIEVQRGLKIGDIDPRGDPTHCTMVSEKSLAIAGGVLEAILTSSDNRKAFSELHAAG